jgi:8-oxoguanine deaminase
MATLLIRNAALVATMDDDGRELADCDVFIDGPAIARVGPDLPLSADETLDGRGCVVVPGLVNTHNHIFQTLYRALPPIQQANFPDWIGYLSGLWLRRPFSPDAVHAAALAAFGEMLLTGCTTASDQHYVFLPGQPHDFIDREIAAAREIGIRFHPARGCVSLGRSKGGLVPDEFAQPEDQILRHAADLIAKYHDTSRYAMLRIVLAPTGIYSDTEAVYREMGNLARAHQGVHCHTHLYELKDEQFSLDVYGMRPLDVMERVGWVGEEFLFYHVINPNADEIQRLARSRSFVSHCVGPDTRMGYGLCPVRELLDAGANLCFGTSGPAANDGCDMLADMRLCLRAHRLRFREPERWLSARDILRIATRGGARGLGREDTGSIVPGQAADLAVYSIDRIDMAGQHDPLAALLFMGASHLTKATIVNGRVVARDGRLLTVDQERVTRDANSWARRLAGGP